MDKSQMNPLSYYNFIEEKSFEPHVYDVQISADDKIISVTEDGKLLGSVTLDIEHNILSLIGKDGEKFSSAELPLVDVITDAYYDEERTSLVIVVKLSDGTDKEILVPFNDLLDDYAKKEEVDAVSDSLETEVQDRAEKDEELKALIDAEIINRENADTAIESKLDNEVNSLKEADANINVKLDTKVEWTDISDSQNPNRKSIILNNHDTILGTSTKGGTSNLVMLSKWDVADFGSKSTHINLNGLYERPTYNDSKPMALIEDVTNLQASIDATIQALQEKDANLQEQINLLSGTEGELSKELEALKAKDIELDSAIKAEESTRSAKDIELQGNIESEATERKTQDDLINQRINDLHTNTEDEIVDIKNLLDEVDKKIQAETTERIKEDGLLQESLDKKVEWIDISTEANPNRKSIVLGNHDTILGTTTDNNTYNLVMLSKWNKADLGSASVELNLNGSALHPTYNDKEEIAFISDITTSSESFSQDIQSLKDKDNELEKRIETEESTRSEKDAELQSNIETEASERIQNDKTLNDKIDNLHQNTDGELTSINNLIDSITLVKDEENDLIYHLMVGEINKGTINIPKDQFLSQVSYDAETNILTFIIEGSEAKSTVSVDLNDLVDTYFAGDGLTLDEKRTFILNIDNASEDYLTLSSNGLKLSGIDSKFATIENLDAEIERAKSEEAKLLGIESDSEEVMSLYGVKKYASINQGEITNINIKIDAVDSKFDSYVTKDDAVQQHDEILNSAKLYTDNKISEEKPNIINESVNQAKTYTDSKISPLNEAITSNTDRISTVESRCDHFDDLFSMILDEHGDPIELNFYTKSEIDTKVEALNNKDTELSEKLDKKVEWVDIATGDNPNRKSIVLENHDTILGKDTKGVASSLLMINKWDVVDLGTTKLPINLNTPSGVRPTVQEAGQTGEEANKIAYLSDIEAVKEELNNINNSTQDSLNKKVDWTDISTEGMEGRKAIVLKNHDTILGTNTSGSTASIAMINKWDVVDLGTTTLPINLNTPKGVRPTVQEAGQSGEEANQIAYLSDIHAVNSTILNLNTTDNLILSRLTVLEEKLAALQKTNVEEVKLDSESEVDFNDNSKDYIISGEETKSTKIQGKTVKLDNLTITNNARTNIKASDVELKGVKLSGDFPKANGNSVININNAEYIVIKDMVFDSSNVYNGIEIGLSSDILPKSILFENCKFLGQFSNNAILIFGTQANAVININNCYFEDLSNPFRLSNNKNTSCTMNITNCKIDKWDVNSPWQGMIILEDYTSKSSEEAIANNLFGDNKITINIINCIGPNGKKITPPTDLSTICGTGDNNQIIYVYYDNGGLIAYDKAKYPTINIL